MVFFSPVGFDVQLTFQALTISSSEQSLKVVFHCLSISLSVRVACYES